MELLKVLPLWRRRSFDIKLGLGLALVAGRRPRQRRRLECLCHFLCVTTHSLNADRYQYCTSVCTYSRALPSSAFTLHFSSIIIFLHGNPLPTLKQATAIHIIIPFNPIYNESDHKQRIIIRQQFSTKRSDKRGSNQIIINNTAESPMVIAIMCSHTIN